jgi:hypothetical protein
MVADFAIHKPVPEKGDDPRNHHVHILLTLRQAQKNGLRPVKTREWNSDAMLVAWRAAWAEHQNRALRAKGLAVEVDHRTLMAQKMEAQQRGEVAKAQTLDRLPEVHVGPQVRQASRREGYAPRSRNRLVGPKRVRVAGEAPERRVRRYMETDKGSRRAWNIAILHGNAERFAFYTAKAERRVAQFRRRLAFYDGQAAFHHGRMAKAKAAKPSWKPWKKIDVMSLFASHQISYKHALRRKKQLGYIISTMDSILNALFGIRENQLARSAYWQRSLTLVLRHLGRFGQGRSRQRLRMLHHLAP